MRTKSLVKGAIILIDSTPFRTWYEQHYGVKMSAKKGTAAAAKQEEEKVEKKSNSVQRKHATRSKGRVIDPVLADHMAAGKVYACIASRPGQSGRCDGYVLEGKELEFYVKKLKAKKGGK